MYASLVARELRRDVSAMRCHLEGFMCMSRGTAMQVGLRMHGADMFRDAVHHHGFWSKLLLEKVSLNMRQ